MKKAVVLISVMAAALLTGCNKQTAKSNSSSQSSSSSKIVRHETKSSSEAPRINIHKNIRALNLRLYLASTVVPGIAAILILKRLENS